jgi:hypothetical protein
MAWTLTPSASFIRSNKETVLAESSKRHEWERRTNVRKLLVKVWMTLDGVFDADTMDHWWLP